MPDRRAGLAVYLERSTLVMIVLGFASGLPFMLVFDTLSAWLRDEGLRLDVIGFFSLATLVFSFKFLWAPLVDRTSVPWLTARLGHRRSWMLACQLIIVVALWLIAGCDPSANLSLMALLAVLVGFTAATQDIAIDAWRIEVVDESRQGAMAAAHQWGYRGAMLVAGAVPLLVAEWYNWRLSYTVMAALMGLGILASLAAPREPAHRTRDARVSHVPAVPLRDAVEWFVRLSLLALAALAIGSGLAANVTVVSGLAGWVGLTGLGAWLQAAWQGPGAVWAQLGAVLAGFVIVAAAVTAIPGIRTRPGTYLGAALIEPVADFATRFGRRALPILALICLYRIGDFLLNIMNPFYLDAGFTLTEVAEVRKVFGLVATMTGVFAGGYAIARLGMARALVIGAIGGPLSNVVFVWLATVGHSVPALFVAICVDNILGGFAGVCLIAYMSSLTSVGFTATQYALLSSLYAIPGRLLASQSGRLVEAAARSADSGGLVSALGPMFSGLGAGSFSAAFERSGVTPVALASGYAAFFIYTCIVALAAVVLAFAVTRMDPGDSPGTLSGEAEPSRS